MMKSVCLLGRRPGLTRAEFQRYYEASHAPLGARHFPFTRYVRNHLQDAEEIGFDTISEFWARDIDATAALMDGPVGDILRADERRFMDQSAIRPAGADEQLLAGPARSLEDPSQDKISLLLRRAPDVSVEAFLTAAQSWGRRIGDQALRVTLDELSAWGERGFGCEAILWVWPGRAGITLDEPPPQVRLWVKPTVRPSETAPEDLLG